MRCIQISELFVGLAQCQKLTEETPRSNYSKCAILFLSFWPQTTLSYHLREIVKDKVSKRDFRKAPSPHTWPKFYQDQCQRQDKLNLLCLMSGSEASTTQLLSQVPELSHVLDVAYQGPDGQTGEHRWCLRLSGWACDFEKNTEQQNLGSKATCTSPGPWNRIPSQSYVGL